MTDQIEQPAPKTWQSRMREWLKRYIPMEILGTIIALLCAYITSLFTIDPLFIALAGTWGESVGFYGYAAGREVAIYAKVHHEKNLMRYVKISWKTTRNLVTEFGLAEAFDTLLIRPFFMYIFQIKLGNMLMGVFVGKLVADVFFYAIAVVGYELRKHVFKD